MIKKKASVLFFVLTLLMLLIALAGCKKKRNESSTFAEGNVQTETRAENEAGIYLSMATNGDWSASFKGQVIEKELEELGRRTGGRVKIKLYDRSRLGDDAHLISGVQTGTIDIVQSSPSLQNNVVPEAALFDIPGFFDTPDEWNALFESSYRQVMEGYYEDAGLELLDVFAYSYRNLSSQYPVVTLSDLQGLRIRTLENKYHQAFWENLGAVAVPYRYAELYFCLHEGIADAQENLLDVMLADNLYEVQKSITFTRHLPMVSVVAMKRERYESLTEEQKEELKRFTGSLKETLIRQMPEEEVHLKETLENDYDIRMLEPSEELQHQITAGADVVLKLLREELGDDKVDNFLRAAEKVRK